MAHEITADVCVLGGGPAGSTVASRLKALGFAVCLVEREVAPRPRIAATLPPGILPLLDALGVRESIERAGFLRSSEVIVWWSEPAPAARAQGGAPGFHVDRAAFDRLLLRHAIESGVHVLQPAQALQPVRSDDGWRIPILHDGERREVRARFVVDACGGRNVLGLKRVSSAPLAALYAEWIDGHDAAGAGRVEAAEEEWFWYAPIGAGRSVAAVFVDPGRIAAMRSDGIEPSYRSRLARFRLFREIRSGRIAGKVRVCDATSTHTTEPAGTDYIQAGDSAFRLDPMSSQGVQSAIASGLQAAIVANTLLRYPHESEIAVAFYRDRHRERVQRHAQKTAELYAERAAVCANAFWRERGNFAPVPSPILTNAVIEHESRIRLSDRASIRSTPAIENDRIVSTPALWHETLERPVAFLGDIAIAPLLTHIESGETVADVVGKWSASMPSDTAWKMMEWLWRRQIVVPFE